MSLNLSHQLKIGTLNLSPNFKFGDIRNDAIKPNLVIRKKKENRDEGVKFGDKEKERKQRQCIEKKRR
jgi:hypothetical protein